MDGFEVCRRLKADPQTSRIPILFVTSNDDLVDKAHGIDIGAVDYITKPFYPDELRAPGEIRAARPAWNWTGPRGLPPGTVKPGC